jgi:3-methyladenine DNA glycosylase AlkD
MTRLDDLRREMRAAASTAKARLLARYFKTGAGQYGEGDVFLGVMVPQTRAVARRYRDLALADIAELLTSPNHEERLCALLILVGQYERGDSASKARLYRFYLKHTRHIDNWDLVDLSAPNIVGAEMLRTDDAGGRLQRLAKSRNLWERRIAVLATFPFIASGRHVPAFNVARLLLHDPHDLIHKALGWMLREVGKRIGQETEEEFLRPNYRQMPRTMLRYAIERFPRRLRQAYLTGRI